LGGSNGAVRKNVGGGGRKEGRAGGTHLAKKKVGAQAALYLEGSRTKR